MTFGTDQSIQPGWTVCASDGEELGTVVSVDPETIHVKKGGLFGVSSMCRARRSTRSRPVASSCR